MAKSVSPIPSSSVSPVATGAEQSHLASIPSIPKTRPKKTASPPTSSIHDSGSNSADSATEINTIAPVIPLDRVEKVNSVETTQSEISEARGIPSVPKTRPSGNQVSKKADSGTVESTSVVGKTEKVSFEVANLDLTGVMEKWWKG